jgi:hypothetical protein
MNDESAELKELKARVAELEAKAKPPAPFDPGPYQRYDPTANFQMPASALREMVNTVPDSMVRDIAMRDGRAPTGPSAQGVVPSSQPLSNIRTGGGGSSGWREPTPLAPPPGVNILDRIMDHEDAKDRAELVERHARMAAMRAAESKP